MMQQAAVSSSSQISSLAATTSTNALLASLTRGLSSARVLDALNECVDSLLVSTTELKVLASRLQAQIEQNLARNINVNGEKSIKMLFDEIRLLLIKNQQENQLVLLDSCLKPAVSSTFFENRHGFALNELLSCRFSNSLAGDRITLFKRSLNCRPIYSRQQMRGFKSKRALKEAKGAGDSDDFFDSKIFKSMFASPSVERLNTVLRQAKASGDLKSKISSLDSAQEAEIDKKLKVAFTEGVLFGSNRAEIKRNLLRFILFLFFAYVALLFINNASNGVNGRNGNASGGSGGINFRALTGNVDYEINPENVTVKFSDVKGQNDVKEELSDLVDFLKDPEQYSEIGARMPKGILMVGPPGCGKTLLAKAVAGEAGVPFFLANGSDFDEMFVGTGSKRVRSLFAAARAKAPCVIFIDEIDSVGSKRTNSTLHPHANQTINQLLAEMDGFKKNEGIIVLGATNRRETLDIALMRPGRFDMEVRLDIPDFAARVEILNYYLGKVARDPNVDVSHLAQQLRGMSAAAIENVVNQGALRAVVTKSKTVRLEHLEWSADRALMGSGKTRIQDEELNKNTAYHEAGHTLVSYYTKDSRPLHKVTILPRTSGSLGHTKFLPERDEYSLNKSQLLAMLDVGYGGRIAEELTFGAEKVSTGASGDFQYVTDIATKMVKLYGMSDKVGTRTFTEQSNSSVSVQTQELIDEEIKRLMTESYERARNILKTHEHELKLLAETLLIHETLDADQVKRIIENKKL